MPSIKTFITSLLALTLLEISPGLDTALTITGGVGQGKRIALFTVLGNVFVAGFVQVSFLVLGLVTVVHACPITLDLLWQAGTAYLMWLDIEMIATSGTDTRLRRTARISDWNVVKEGALNSLIDPKSLLFMFAFLSQFVDPAAGPVWLQLLILGSIQKLAGVMSLGSVAMTSGTFGDWLGKHPAFIKRQERFTGVVMITLRIEMLFDGSGVVSVQEK